MIDLAVCLGAAALFGGISVTAGRIYKRPRTVPELMASVDTKLATEMCFLASHEPLTQDRMLWEHLGGARGLWHMLGQARLWVNIVLEIRKDDPSLFGDEAGAVSARMLALYCAAFRSVLQSAGRRASARVCVYLFADIATIAESVLIESEPAAN